MVAALEDIDGLIMGQAVKRLSINVNDLIPYLEGCVTIKKICSTVDLCP